MAEVAVQVAIKPLKERLNFVENRMVGMESTILILQKANTSEDKTISEKKAIYEQLAHLNEVDASLNEKIRLLNQRHDNLATSISPAHLELKMQEVIDTVYKLQNDLKTHQAEVQRLKQVTYGVVTYEEIVALYKQSGLTQRQLAEYIHLDFTRVSRVLSGELKKDDQQLYHQIKDECLKAIVKLNK